MWLLCRTIGGISLNWPRYCDEERDALILEVMATPDDADRAPILQELVQKINDDYLYVFFNHTMWQNAFAADVNGVCDREAPDGTIYVGEVESDGFGSSQPTAVQHGKQAGVSPPLRIIAAGPEECADLAVFQFTPGWQALATNRSEIRRSVELLG